LLALSASVKTTLAIKKAGVGEVSNIRGTNGDVMRNGKTDGPTPLWEYGGELLGSFRVEKLSTSPTRLVGENEGTSKVLRGEEGNKRPWTILE